MKDGEHSWSMMWGQVVVISLNQGDDLLEGIVAACRRQDVRHAAIVAGVGTLDRCRLRVVTDATTDYPSAEEVREWEGKPFELVGISGIVVDGSPHVHVTIAHRGRTSGGHLEPGSRVLNLAEIVIAELVGETMSRRPDARGVLRLLR